MANRGVHWAQLQWRCLKLMAVSVNLCTCLTWEWEETPCQFHFFWEARLSVGPLLASPTAAKCLSQYEIPSQRHESTVGVALSRLTKQYVKRRKDRIASRRAGCCPVPALDSPVDAPAVFRVMLRTSDRKTIWSQMYFLLRSDSKDVLGKCIYLFNLV